MRFNKRLGVLAGVAVAALFLVACGGNQSSSSTDTKTWSRMEGDVISSMDSAVVTDAISGQALVDTMDGLYRYAGSDLQPAMASKIVTPTNDGKTYTFKLRDAKWSNGDPVTAQDFVFAWKRAIDPKTKSQYAYLFSGIVNADDIMAGKKAASTLGVKAIDDKTFEVTLDHAIPYFGTMMVNPVFFPQNQKVVEKAGKNYGTNSDNIVSNGPFILKNWNGTGNSWNEVKNKDYWNAKNVKLNKINVQVIKDPSTAMNLYQSGKLDDATLSGAQAAQAKTMKDVTALKQATTFYLELNEKKTPALKNEKLRQAISMSLNRKEFIDKVLQDSSVAPTGLVPENLAKNPTTGEDFSKEAAKTTSQYTKYDKTEAKKLWSEGLKETNVKSLNLELLTDDTDVAKKSSEYFQSALEDLPGLKLTISSVPFKTRLTRSQNGQFDMVISAWGADFPDPITFLDMFTSSNSYNNGKWSNADYDKLIADSKGKDATNPEARWNDLLKAQEILTKEQGIIPIYQRAQTHLVNKKMHDLQYSPANMYNFVNAYLK
ncbi:peptide ABC transporter substrate-binding protein [Lacticaseibacillus brantae]|uniref:Abc transporter, substrate-binding protein, family 5 n=1 Tax=Lacticaseibacillus brantae DSM 23927 TaxID=1423727 RepID=A0A0R2AVZ5_9LACO|nr:peptide ABC transporter substrate-binding protein [Lacticaseibacillus brantae]KRM71614.1 abc transporter, substrate-binding protein, family 5 [Lacticaseibacillus brantae DSM 23927]